MIFFRVYLAYKRVKLSHMHLMLLPRCATLDETEWSYYLYTFVVVWIKVEVITYTLYAHTFLYFPVLF